MAAVALTIAGSDPSGGAGLQADLKAFHQFGVYGEAVVTLVTVQNTRSVSAVETLGARLVAEQIEAVVSDIPPGAAKTGALGTAAIVEAVAAAAARFAFPLVVDPVMISKHGAPLIGADGASAVRHRLLPRAYLVTPNRPEAEELAGAPIRTAAAARDAAKRIRDLGAANVLIKGGHFEGAADDWLLTASGDWVLLPGDRVDTPHTHGTGCTYSAAITAGLALGDGLAEAVRRAKGFIAAAIAGAPGLGGGNGPVNHFAAAPARGKG
ncbi:MAG: bifunctional hydroxymethylpyrimidine kinase/phosphomethylpyrimidine kinase [Bryobacteraceae bacterium]